MQGHQWSEQRTGRGPIAAALANVGIWLAQSMDPPDADYVGRVSVPIGAGFTSRLGHEQALEELEGFLAAATRADVRAKLADSGRPERHAVVWVDQAGASSSYWLFAGQRYEGGCPEFRGTSVAAR